MTLSSKMFPVANCHTICIGIVWIKQERVNFSNHAPSVQHDVGMPPDKRQAYIDLPIVGFTYKPNCIARETIFHGQYKPSHKNIKALGAFFFNEFFLYWEPVLLGWRSLLRRECVTVPGEAVLKPSPRTGPLFKTRAIQWDFNLDPHSGSLCTALSPRYSVPI